MASSRRGARRALAVLAAWPFLLGAAGCATPRPTPPEPAPPAPRAESPPPSGTPSADTPVRVPQPAAERSPARLDTSEVMTPEELATIPDPIAGKQDAGGRASPPSSRDTAVSEARSDAPGGSAPGATVWRVQILATPDRQLADRVAAEAADRLGTVARVDVESSLFKVRLGGFATEGEAQGLRERAIEMGYPGAFRVKGANP